MKKIAQAKNCPTLTKELTGIGLGRAVVEMFTASLRLNDLTFGVARFSLMSIKETFQTWAVHVAFVKDLLAYDAPSWAPEQPDEHAHGALWHLWSRRLIPRFPGARCGSCVTRTQKSGTRVVLF